MRHRRWQRSRRVLVVGLLAGGPVLTWPSSARADEPLRSFTLAATGDILAHVAVNTQAWTLGNKTSYDYAPMMAEVEPLIAGADLAICHLEGPVAPPGTKITGQPVFGSPAGIAASIKNLGYDRCSTASNHSLDRGVAGINATLDAFDAVGLGASGTARTLEEAVEPVVEVNGVKVVHLSYSYDFNGRRRPPNGELWRANLIDPARIIADASNARSRGAEVVIVSLHWGSEFRQTVTRAQRTLANTLTASGQIDLIIGHHAHVLQPIEQINGRWVVFGMGNILSNQRPGMGTPPPSQDGAVFRFTISENGGGGFTVGRPEVTPTWILNPPCCNVLRVADHVEDMNLPGWLRNRLKESWKRTMKVVGAYVVA